MPARAKVDLETRRETKSVAVLIATRGRRELLQSRALASVARQLRAPEYLVVIEDTLDPRRESTRRAIHRRDFPKTKLIVSRNVRSPGVSGAWNTGLARLAEIVPDPAATYVAILDDDDAYDVGHLAACFQRAEQDDLDLVAAGMWRHERSNEPPIEQHPPEEMVAAEFLVRSQHLQGSNLFVRLSILLEAGCFDEGQTSTTDRDVCTRLADLPKLRYARLGVATVHHHAEPERERMSTPRSITRCKGVTEFHEKWRSRMSAVQERASRMRARELFAWIDPPPPFDVRLETPPREGTRARDGEPDRLLIASVVRKNGADSAADFLRRVRSDSNGKTIDALWLTGDAANLRETTERLAREGQPVRVCETSRVRDLLGVSSEESLRASPLALLGLLASSSVEVERGAAVWIVRDDFSPDVRVATRSLELDLPVDPFASLSAARSRGSAFCAGWITGDDPGAPEFACRVELVDVLHNLYWLGKSDPASALVDRGAENGARRRARNDWNVDASLFESDRTERPIWLTPNSSGETVENAFLRMCRGLEGILEGRRVFRHALLDATSFSEDSTHASSNLLVLDPAVLRDAPLLSSLIPTTREARNFGAFGALQHRAFGRECKSGGIPVRRVAREKNRAPDLSRLVESIVDDSATAAFAACLADGSRHRAGASLELDAATARRFERAFDRAWRERARRVTLSWYRTHGLARSILRRARPQGSPWAWWWKDGRERTAIREMRAFARGIRADFSVEKLREFRERLEGATARVDGRCLQRVESAMREHRVAVEDPDLRAKLRALGSPT